MSDYVAETATPLTADTRLCMGKPEDAACIYKRWRNAKREHFVALYLDTKNHLLGKPYVVSIGTLNASIVHPREVLRPALLRAAYGLIVLHNHPSGDPTPSKEDLDFTRQLDAGCKLLGLRLLDHIVVGRTGIVSLKERGVF